MNGVDCFSCIYCAFPLGILQKKTDIECVVERYDLSSCSFLRQKFGKK
jgi:hypothetical protein